MRKTIAAGLLFLGVSLVGAPSALALNPQPEPPGVLRTIGQVTATYYRVLPPNPRVLIPGLPPGPSLSGRG